MCDRIMPRSKRRCTRPDTRTLLVEMTGEEVRLCEICAALYLANQPITYAPKDGKRWT